MIVCDFCSSDKVVWRYEALSSSHMPIPGVMFETIGAWAACDECSSLIEMKDKMALQSKSLDTFISKFKFPLSPEHSKIFRGMIEMLHGQFWLCKYGERKEVKNG